MNQNDIDNIGFGYDQCRDVVLSVLRKILSKRGLRVALEEFIEKLEDDKEREHGEQIQKEQPGITLEEYEAQLEKDFKLIREKYYSKQGYLKPRLVRTLKVEEDSHEE